MGALKNIRHEKFARELIRANGNASEAYRRAYPNCRAPDSAWVNASRLLRQDKVKKRTLELRQIMAKRADITEDKILTDYEYALQLAKEQDKPNDIVSAATAQAKLVGLLRDRVEAGNVGDFDNAENVSDIIEGVNNLLGSEAATALLKAFKLANRDDLEQAKPASEAVN